MPTPTSGLSRSPKSGAASTAVAATPVAAQTAYATPTGIPASRVRASSPNATR